MPFHLTEICHQTQGHRSDANDPFFTDFVKRIEGGKRKVGQLYGWPDYIVDWESIARCGGWTWGVQYTLFMPIRKAVEIQVEIDNQQRLHADVPQSLPPGSVRVNVLTAEEDEAGSAWEAGVSSEWSSALSDPAQDIYTLNDGQPSDAPR